MKLSYFWLILLLAIILPASCLPSIEEIFGRLWNQRQNTKEEKKTQKAKTKRETSRAPIGDGSQIPWEATADL